MTNYKLWDLELPLIIFYLILTSIFRYNIMLLCRVSAEERLWALRNRDLEIICFGFFYSCLKIFEIMRTMFVVFLDKHGHLFLDCLPREKPIIHCLAPQRSIALLPSVRTTFTSGPPENNYMELTNYYWLWKNIAILVDMNIHMKYKWNNIQLTIWCSLGDQDLYDLSCGLKHFQRQSQKLIKFKLWNCSNKIICVPSFQIWWRNLIFGELCDLLLNGLNQ